MVRNRQPPTSVSLVLSALGLGSCLLPPVAADETSTSTDSTSTGTSAPADGSTSDATSEPTTGGSESADGSTTGTAQMCERNTDCESTERCSDGGVCVTLLSTECTELVWPGNGAIRDDVVFLGSIVASDDPYTGFGRDHENAVRLAFEDFDATGTLQGDRRVAWVGCDDSAGVTAALSAATHLIEQVGVPAIVGPMQEENLVAVADVAVPAGVFVMSPLASAPSITQRDDDDLVWQTLTDDVFEVSAIVDRIEELDATGTGIDRLLLLAQESLHGQEIQAGVVAGLEDRLPGVPYVSDTYPDPADFRSQEEMLNAYSAVLAGIAFDAPYSHIVLVGGAESQVFLYSYLGTIWDPGADPLPLFTVTHGTVGELERFITDIGELPGTEALVPLKPLLETNLQATSPVFLNPVNFLSFSIRYRVRFGMNEVPSAFLGLAYDATLATLFAATTVATDTPLTGAAIAEGMPRLRDPGGEFISFSGEDIAFIADALEALSAGGSVDLQGISGELEWDLATGAIRTGGWGWDICDDTVDGSQPTMLFTREYVLDAAPATTGTWGPLQPCP